MSSGQASSPIPLVQLTSDGRLAIVPESARFIQSIKSPLSIICIAGRYRTGKSYLLNALLKGTGRGFLVSPSIHPCTKGIYVWVDELEHNGSRIVFVDTEGLCAVDSDRLHDTKILALSLLISSLFIYNTVGSVDDRALDELNVVVNVLDRLERNTSPGDTKTLDPPMFVWLLRDFSLQMVDDQNRPISAPDYLEYMLHKRKRQEIDILTRHLPYRTCFALVRPTLDEKSLQTLNNKTSIRPEFLSQVKKLQDLVFQNAKPKTIRDKPLYGHELIDLLRSTVELLNAGNIPPIGCTWAVASSLADKRTKDEAIQIYVNELSNKFKDRRVVSEATFIQISLHAQHMAELFFNKRRFNEDPSMLCEIKEAIKREHDIALRSNCDRGVGLAKSHIKNSMKVILDTPPSHIMDDFINLVNESLVKAPDGIPLESLVRCFVENIQGNLGHTLRQRIESITSKLIDINIKEKKNKWNNVVQAKDRTICELQTELSKGQAKYQELLKENESLQQRNQEHVLAISEQHQRDIVHLNQYRDKLEQIDLNSKQASSELEEKNNLLNQANSDLSTLQSHFEEQYEIFAKRDQTLQGKLEHAKAKIQALEARLAQFAKGKKKDVEQSFRGTTAPKKVEPNFQVPPQSSSEFAISPLRKRPMTSRNQYRPSDASDSTSSPKSAPSPIRPLNPQLPIEANIDPNTLTKIELKRFLTHCRVALPVQDQSKKFYVDLFNAQKHNLNGPSA